MSARWLILGDDLTGAADSAIAFAARGIRSCVIWNSMPAPRHFEVVAYHTASRELPAQKAAQVNHDALERCEFQGTRLFKKIDSTLRGQPAAEIRAIHDRLRLERPSMFGIVAPAYPAVGRTTLGGRVYVSGQPLEMSETWARDHTYTDADLIRILQTVGIDAVHVSLPVIRDGQTSLAQELSAIARRGAFAVCDAEVQEDLVALARASAALSAPHFFVGSGGFAQALADECEPAAASRRASTLLRGRGSLIVVGSLASASRAAARELARDAHMHRVPIEGRLLFDPGALERANRVSQMTQVLSNGDDVLAIVELDAIPAPELIPQLAQALGAILEPAAHVASAIVATGGETAAAVLQTIGAEGIELLRELEPGICLGMTMGRLRVPVVTKAGAFGDAQCLVRVVRQMRQLRELGTI